jgi:hypothetical protein
VGAEKTVIPDVVLKAHAAGLDVFDVEYISPAKRFQQAEKLKGLMTANDTIMNMAQLPVFAGMTDSVDIDADVHKIFELSGAPMDVLRTLEQLKVFREANKKQRDSTAQLEQEETKSNIALKTNQARAALGTAPALPPVGAGSK